MLGFEANKWARWNPVAGRYVGYGVDPNHFTWLDASSPGKGYWGVFDGGLPTLIDGTPAPSDDAFVVSLDPGSQSGWVQIGCPRMTGVSWRSSGDEVVSLLVRSGSEEMTLSEAKTAGWCEDFAWAYRPGAGYELVADPVVYTVGQRDELHPWEGYWFLVHHPVSWCRGRCGVESEASPGPPARMRS